MATRLENDMDRDEGIFAAVSSMTSRLDNDASADASRRIAEQYFMVDE